MPIAFSTWTVLLNNFVVERAGFTGVEIGILQSLREVPGFLAFTTVFVLLILKEQTFAVIALALLGIGVALTGFFPTTIGLYLTTVLMSMGFHYFEVVKQSLSLQWYPKADAPRALGKLISVGSITSLIVYASLWVFLARSAWTMSGYTCWPAACAAASPSSCGSVFRVSVQSMSRPVRSY